MSCQFLLVTLYTDALILPAAHLNKTIQITVYLLETRLSKNSVRDHFGAQASISFTKALKGFTLDSSEFTPFCGVRLRGTEFKESENSWYASVINF